MDDEISLFGDHRYTFHPSECHRNPSHSNILIQVFTLCPALGFGSIIGKSVVIHAPDESRITCGNIEQKS